MDVKKIFIMLITVVVCVLLGALVINALLPNVTTTVIDAVESMIFNATALEFDWNDNGVGGGAGAGGREFQGEAGNSRIEEGTVEGFN